MKQITRKNIRITILTILCIICLILLRYSSANTAPFFQIGPLNLPSSTKNGVLSGLLALFCFLLVFTDYKKGFLIGLAINTIALGSLIFGMIMMHSIVSMPGLVTLVVSFITLLTIYSAYKKISISNFTDVVTGQHNRRCYVKEITEHIELRKAFTIACVELEDFKHINDLYGIQTGDFLLKKAAEKISTILNKNDKLFRLTGSTFVILFEPGESPEERLKKIITPTSVMVPLRFDFSRNQADDDSEISYNISLSIGLVYCYPPYNSKKTASSVLHDAETALAATRNMTTQKLCIYNESMENQEEKQREAEYLVKEALKNDDFYLVYQPQFTSKDRKLRGFETLIRCRNSDGLIVNPSFFIPAAENTNLIIQVDEFVLNTAMKEFKPIFESSSKDLTLSINVSAKNIGSTDFIPRIRSLVENTGFPAEKLEFEITEYSFADSLEITISNIQKLREMGIKIALDDFGTGYTSIKQLMSLPINLLKIDKSLIDDIEKNQSMKDMIDSVIYMGHIMNCEVISEGVEKNDQLDFLIRHNCDFIQGFVWSQPLSYEDAKLLCE